MLEKRISEFEINVDTKRLTSLDIHAQMMFEILDVQIFILNTKKKQWPIMIF